MNRHHSFDGTFLWRRNIGRGHGEHPEHHGRTQDDQNGTRRRQCSTAAAVDIELARYKHRSADLEKCELRPSQPAEQKTGPAPVDESEKHLNHEPKQVRMGVGIGKLKLASDAQVESKNHAQNQPDEPHN